MHADEERAGLMPRIRAKVVATLSRSDRPRAKKVLRRVWCRDGLWMPRIWMWGPRWMRYFNVQLVPIATFAPHRAGKKLLVVTLEDDLRELMFQEIRPGVYADWSDPREQLGLTERRRA